MIESRETPSVESDLTGTLEEHWRKGIPTLILLLLATFVSCYYWLLVKPGIQRRYSSIVQSNLKLLGIDDVDVIELKANPDDTNVELTAERRIAILKETQIAIRRLIGWNPSDDSVHFRYGIVSNILSSSYLREAFSSGNEATTAMFLGMAKTEHQNATGAMERVRKLSNSFEPKASLWLVNRKFEEKFAMPSEELLAIENALRQLIDSESVASSAKLALIQVLVERSLRVSSGLTGEKSLELLADADKLFQSASASGVISLSLHAEANAIADPAVGQEYANKALQCFWSTRETESQSLESLAAVFRCLLIINSVKEAQIFLSEQLQQISAVDQSRFRSLTAAAALRHLVSMAILEDRTLRTIRENSSPDASIAVGGAEAADVSTADRNLPLTARVPGGAADLSAVLSMTVQLNPQSLELLSLLERLARASDEDDLVVSLKRAMGLQGDRLDESGPRSVPATLDAGVKSFLLSVAGLGEGVLDKTVEDALVAALKSSPAYGVVASRLAMSMNVSGAVNSGLAIRWLKAINTAAPEVLVAWSDRANLHLKDKQFQEAIECYEYLLEKLPGNEQITEALEVARNSLTIRG